jgi:F0F1-type ATP synthase assembly protein I
MPKSSSTNSNKYLKYSGIGFTLFALLGIAVYAGQKLDAYLELEQPWFTILFLLLGFGGWVAKLMKDLEMDAKD